MSEYSKARCKNCDTLFWHENATNETCGTTCDIEWRKKQEQAEQEEQSNE